MPDSTRSAYDSPDAEPDLSGNVTEQRSFSLDLAVLDDVNPMNWNQIFGHLAADAEWRLCEYDHAIVAMQRADGHLPRTGFHDGSWRVLYRFTAWDAELPWTVAENIARVPAGHEQFEAPIFGDDATAVVIEGLDLSLQVYEQGGPQHTQSAIDAAGPAVKRWLETAAAPSGHVRSSGVVLIPMNGAFELQAWLNPKQPGWTWMRVIDNKGVVFEEAAVAIASREAVGFSLDDREFFYMQGVIPLPQGPGFKGTAEFWTRPAMGGEDVRIAVFEVEVPERP